MNELLDLPPHSAILALGGVAHKGIIKAMGLQQSKYKFRHSAEYLVQQKIIFLVDGYRNTFLGYRKTNFYAINEKSFLTVNTKLK